MSISNFSKRHAGFGHASHENVSKSSSHLMKILLKKRETDPCLEVATNKAQSECLQPVLETYYDKLFTTACPGFSLVLAQYECTGCSRARIGPSKVSQVENINLPLQPKRLFFHNASADCRTSDHVMAYRELRTVIDFVYKIGLIVSVLLVLISAVGAYSVSQDGVLKPAKIFRVNAPEALYLACLLITSDIADINDYYRYCETLSSIYTQSQIVIVAYASMLSISLTRCVRLPNFTENENGSVRSSSRSLLSLSPVHADIVNGILCS